MDDLLFQWSPSYKCNHGCFSAQTMEALRRRGSSFDQDFAACLVAGVTPITLHSSCGNTHPPVITWCPILKKKTVRIVRSEITKVSFNPSWCYLQPEAEKPFVQNDLHLSQQMIKITWRQAANIYQFRTGNTHVSVSPILVVSLPTTQNKHRQKAGPTQQIHHLWFSWATPQKNT